MAEHKERQKKWISENLIFFIHSPNPFAHYPIKGVEQ